MSDLKEMVYAARRAEVGVTPLGIVVLRANAHAYGFGVDEDGRVIDPDTNALVTDNETLEPIYKRAQEQMVTTSKTGEELLKK